MRVNATTTIGNTSLIVNTNENRVGINLGTQFASSTLTIFGTATQSGSNAATAGTYSNLNLNNTTASGSQFGHRTLVNIVGTTAGSMIGEFVRTIDNTSLVNTVRGLEVQAFSGTNVFGTNTGIASFGKTFGVHAVTTVEAGAVSLPAALFADLDNAADTTTGNAIRAFSNEATTAKISHHPSRAC